MFLRHFHKQHGGGLEEAVRRSGFSVFYDFISPIIKEFSKMFSVKLRNNYHW